MSGRHRGPVGFRTGLPPYQRARTIRRARLGASRHINRPSVGRFTRARRGAAPSRISEIYRGFEKGTCLDAEVLKFPGPVAWPALNHYLLVGVKLHAIAPLAVENAEETVLPSAEREVGHGSRNPNVYAD